jgi:putative endonuclease
MWYVYVIRSTKSDYWYTGFTNNLRRRFIEHQKGLSGWTKTRGPYDLVYYEACKDKDDARSRELFLKSGMGKRFLKNRLKRFLSLT